MPPNNSKRVRHCFNRSSSAGARICTNLGHSMPKMETSLRRAGVSPLEVHGWRLPTTESELLPLKNKKVRSPLPSLLLLYHALWSSRTTHHTNQQAFLGLSDHLCGNRSGVRGGEDAATLAGALSPLPGSGGSGSGRVMSPVDSHDYHYGPFPILLGLFSFLLPLYPFLALTEATRPLSFCDSA